MTLMYEKLQRDEAERKAEKAAEEKRRKEEKADEEKRRKADRDAEEKRRKEEKAEEERRRKEEKAEEEQRRKQELEERRLETKQLLETIAKQPPTTAPKATEEQTAVTRPTDASEGAAMMRGLFDVVLSLRDTIQHGGFYNNRMQQQMGTPLIQQPGEPYLVPQQHLYLTNQVNNRQQQPLYYPNSQQQQQQYHKN